MIDRFEMAVFPDLPTLDLWCHKIGLGNSWTGSSPTYGPGEVLHQLMRIQGCEVMDISMTSDFTGKTCGSTNFSLAFPPKKVLNARGQSNQCIQLHVWVNSYHLEAPWYGWIIYLVLQDELSSMAGKSTGNPNCLGFSIIQTDWCFGTCFFSFFFF